MKKRDIVILLFLVGLFSSCNDDFMDRFPETSIGKENFFNSEEDLAMYAYNLYNFPNIIYAEDAYRTSDNAANTGNTEIKTMMVGNPSSATITGGWNWAELRNINFFLENLRKADIPEEALNHYEGLGRFFRARFYMEMVSRFSDVPWYDQTISTDDEELLYKARDPRETVVTNLFADYEFARQHVRASGQPGEVTSWVVAAFQARHALYEGTFRKYHPELGLEASAATYLEMARDVASDIIENGGFSIYSTGDPMSDYGSLFTSTNLAGNPEVILMTINEQDVRDSGWWEWMFGDYETCPSRDLLQAYLMADGSFYSSQNGGDIRSMPFVQEFENRDPRVYQTFAYPGWTLIRTGTYAQGAGVYVQRLQKNFSGYHQIKGFINDLDNAVVNSVDVPVFRYAEVLLIYAEALAELGELTQGDLDQTINVLRDRAGMPHLTMNPPVDPWQESKYPSLSGTHRAELLEIRRERRVELAHEGYRADDLMRWAAGKLLEKEPEGLYFPGLGKYDLTGDGVEDIILIDVSESIPDAANKEVNALGVTLQYYRVGPVDSDAGVYLENGTGGTVITVRERGSFIEPQYYYRPVPETHTKINPNLLPQLFGWN